MPLRWLAYALLYAAMLLAGRSLVLPDTGLSLLWPASGISALWALTAHDRVERAIIAPTITAVSFAGSVMTGLSIGPALVFAVANGVVPLAASATACWLARRIPSLRIPDADHERAPLARLISTADVVRLLTAAGTASVCSAIIGMAGLALSGVQPGFSSTLAWIVRHAAAIVVVTGPVLALRAWPLIRSWQGIRETVFLFAITPPIQYLVLGPGQSLPISFVSFALVLWAAFRLPMPLAAVHGALVSVSALALVLAGASDALGHVLDPGERAVVVQVFMLVVSALALLVAGGVSDRRQLNAMLESSERHARVQADQLRTIVETIPDGLAVIDADRKILVCNEAIGRFTTIDDEHDQSILTPLRKEFPDGRPFPYAQTPSLRALRGEAVHDLRVRAADPLSGDPRIFSISAVPLLSETDRIEYAVMLFRDVTAEHDHVDQLRREHDRAERLFADAPHGLVVLDLDGTIRKVNQRLCAITGRPASSLLGTDLAELTAPGASSLREYLERAVASGGHRATADWAITRSTGELTHLSLSSRALLDDDPPTILMNVLDISEQRHYEQQLAHMAEHDALTGLANRHQFDKALAAHLERCERDGPHGAMLLMDLDHFKEVNDILGHAAGDQLLVTIGSILRRSFRKTDVVARLGGDEFGVLLPDADQEVAAAKADILVQRIAEEIATLDGVRRRVTASVGATTFAAAARRGSHPMVLADMLMYDAKDAGRNGVAILDEADLRQPRSGASMAWRARLERAIREDLFTVLLQPILDLRTNRIDGAEALVRLADDDELISPGRFIYIAERSGLIADLDAWVVRHAMAMLPLLRTHSPTFTLGINISGHSVADPRVERALVESIADVAAQPGNIVVEMTETAAVEDFAVAREFVERMRRIGVEFALDDFGAGFASFRYLKHLPFDRIKIDGDFVTGAHLPGTDQTILRSIVAGAHDLGKRTVAEWVGDEQTLQIVRELGVDLAQGYHIGPPVAIDEFIETHLACTDNSSPHTASSTPGSDEQEVHRP